MTDRILGQVQSTSEICADAQISFCAKQIEQFFRDINKVRYL